MADGNELWDVVVVGAGPSGLSLAIELGRRGIKCLVIEQHDRVGYAPRAKTTHSRTREHLRRWGIADTLLAASPFDDDYPSDVIFATRMNGRVLATFENAFSCSRERNDLYAEHAQWIPQYTLEEVLRAHAASLPGVTIRFNVVFETAEQRDDRTVSVRVKPIDGEPEQLTARFLVGADGARSVVRDLLGISMQGNSGLSSNTNIIFRAHGTETKMRMPPGIMYWLLNPDSPGGASRLDSGEVWSFGTRRKVETHDEAKAAINSAFGFDVGAEILSMDRWTAHALVAERYRSGSIFLIGDACHLHPPYGGFGMNMGIGDGVDLGWKLAAYLAGWGGEALLDSYEIERAPLHRWVISEAVSNHKTTSTELSAAGLEMDGPESDALRATVAERILREKAREFRTLGVVLGGRYGQSPIIIPDGTPPLPQNGMEYRPNAVPGSRAPHAWLSSGTERGASLFDRFGEGYTLLALGGSSEGLDEFADAARKRGVPLDVVELGGFGLSNLYETDFVLIRPDQHVAWRGNDLRQSAEIVEIVSGHRGERESTPRVRRLTTSVKEGITTGRPS